MYSFLLLFAFAALVSAKTDYDGCVSSETVVHGGASILWYVPDTGEICQYLDCGGGRAPPKTTVPGCAAYEGTATYSPSFLFQLAASTTAAASTSTSPSSASITESESTSSSSAFTSLNTDSSPYNTALGTTSSTTSITSSTTGSQSTSSSNFTSTSATSTSDSSSDSTSTSTAASGSAPAATQSVNAGAVVCSIGSGLIGVMAAACAFVL